jgi:hypothetical protein
MWFQNGNAGQGIPSSGITLSAQALHVAVISATQRLQSLSLRHGFDGGTREAQQQRFL